MPFIDQVQQTPEMPLLLELQSCMMRVLSELDDKDRDAIERCDIQKMSQEDLCLFSWIVTPCCEIALTTCSTKATDTDDPKMSDPV